MLPLVADGKAEGDLRRLHHEEVRQATRVTGLLAGAVLVVAWPLWALFDHVHEPAQAGSFLALRLVVEVLILLVWVALWPRRFGTRHAETLVLVLLGLAQAAIAWMVGRVDGRVEPYLLGFSLPLYGSAVLLTWRPQLTAVLIGIAALAVALGLATAPESRTATDLTTVIFYGGTAAVVAYVGQLYRRRLAWREFHGRAALMSEQERSNHLLQELERLSREDSLTGVANRRQWDEGAGLALARARRTDSELAVVLCDIDHFKHVNDRLGHAEGDTVLRSIAERIVDGVRAGDLVARIGGDEFAVLCPDLGLEDATAMAVRLRRMRSPAGAALPTVSLGVATLQRTDASVDELLARADRELYRAKLTRDAVWADGQRHDVPATVPTNT